MDKGFWISVAILLFTGITATATTISALSVRKRANYAEKDYKLRKARFELEKEKLNATNDAGGIRP
jgi:hypothetical protein